MEDQEAFNSVTYNNAKKRRLSSPPSVLPQTPPSAPPENINHMEYSLFSESSPVDEHILSLPVISPLHFDGCEPSSNCPLRRYLENKGNPNFVNSSGYSLLHVATARGHTDCVKLLLRASAQVDAFGPDGYTPLMVAVATDNAELSSLLLNNKANVHACRFDATMPLFIAAANGCCKALEVLISAGADLTLYSSSGLSPLIAAALRGQTEAMKMLIANGASVHCRSLTGCNGELSLSRNHSATPSPSTARTSTLNGDGRYGYNGPSPGASPMSSFSTVTPSASPSCSPSHGSFTHRRLTTPAPPCSFPSHTRTRSIYIPYMGPNRNIPSPSGKKGLRDGDSMGDIIDPSVFSDFEDYSSADCAKNQYGNGKNPDRNAPVSNYGTTSLPPLLEEPLTGSNPSRIGYEASTKSTKRDVFALRPIPPDDAAALSSSSLLDSYSDDSADARHDGENNGTGAGKNSGVGSSADSVDNGDDIGAEGLHMSEELSRPLIDVDTHNSDENPHDNTVATTEMDAYIEDLPNNPSPSPLPSFPSPSSASSSPASSCLSLATAAPSPSPALILPSFSPNSSPLPPTCSPSPSHSSSYSLSCFSTFASPLRHTASNILLLWCAKLGWVECMRVLLDAGVDVDTRDRQGWTALHVIAEGIGLEQSCSDCDDDDDDQEEEEKVSGVKDHRDQDAVEREDVYLGKEMKMEDTTKGESNSVITGTTSLRANVFHQEHVDEDGPVKQKMSPHKKERVDVSERMCEVRIREERMDAEERKAELRRWRHEMAQQTIAKGDGASMGNRETEYEDRSPNSGSDVTTNNNDNTEDTNSVVREMRGIDADDISASTPISVSHAPCCPPRYASIPTPSADTITLPTAPSTAGGSTYASSPSSASPMPLVPAFTNTDTITDTATATLPSIASHPQVPPSPICAHPSTSSSSSLLPLSSTTTTQPAESLQTCPLEPCLLRTASSDYRTSSSENGTGVFSESSPGISRAFSDSIRGDMEAQCKPIFYKYWTRPAPSVSSSSSSISPTVRKNTRNSKFPPKMSKKTRDRKTRELVSLLISRNANPYILHRRYLSPLHVAACKGNLSALSALIASGVDIEDMLHSGATPLHSAVRCGQVESVRLLLRSGANVHAEDEKGVTAADLAVEKGQIGCLRVLLEHVASNGRDGVGSSRDGAGNGRGKPPPREKATLPPTSSSSSLVSSPASLSPLASPASSSPGSPRITPAALFTAAHTQLSCALCSPSPSLLVHTHLHTHSSSSSSLATCPSSAAYSPQDATPLAPSSPAPQSSPVVLTDSSMNTTHNSANIKANISTNTHNDGSHPRRALLSLDTVPPPHTLFSLPSLPMPDSNTTLASSASVSSPTPSPGSPSPSTNVPIPRYPPLTPLASHPLCYSSSSSSSSSALIGSSVAAASPSAPHSAPSSPSSASSTSTSTSTSAPSLCPAHTVLMHRCLCGTSLLMRACAHGDAAITEMLLDAIDRDYSQRTVPGVTEQEEEGVKQKEGGQEEAKEKKREGETHNTDSPSCSSSATVSTLRLLPSLFAVDKLDRPPLSYAAAATQPGAVRIVGAALTRVAKELWGSSNDEADGQAEAEGGNAGGKGVVLKRQGSDIGVGGRGVTPTHSFSSFTATSPSQDTNPTAENLGTGRGASASASAALSNGSGGELSVGAGRCGIDDIDDIDDCVSPTAAKGWSNSVPVHSASTRDDNVDDGILSPISIDVDDIDSTYQSPMPTPFSPSFSDFSLDNPSISLQTLPFPHIRTVHHHPLLTSLLALAAFGSLPVLRAFLPLLSLPPPLAIDINSAWSDGTTALSLAATYGRTLVCELLLRNGADATLPPLQLPRAPLHTAANASYATVATNSNGTSASGTNGDAGAGVNSGFPSRTLTEATVSLSMPHLSPIVRPRAKSAVSSFSLSRPPTSVTNDPPCPATTPLPTPLFTSTATASSSSTISYSRAPSCFATSGLANIAPPRAPTLISLALASCKPVCAQAFINKGAKARPQDLWIASVLGEQELVESLLRTGVRTTCRVWYGSTALMGGVMGGNVHICKLLLEHQAEICAADDSGHNAYTLACEMGEEKLISLLRPPVPCQQQNCGGSLLGMLSRVWGKFRKAVDKK